MTLEYYDDHLIQTSTSYAQPFLPNTRLDDYTSELSFAIAYEHINVDLYLG